MGPGSGFSGAPPSQSGGGFSLGGLLGGIGTFLGGPLGGTVGSLLGGLFGRKSSKRAAEEQRRWDAHQAQLNRNFQERMSNTAVQRRMADMQRAGINPVLAARFDANTPAGSMAHASPNTALAGLQGGNTAMQMVAQAKNLQMLEKQMANVEADTELKGAQTALTFTMERLKGYDADIRQPAAMALQTLMELLPTDDPVKAAKMIERAAQKFVDRYGPTLLHNAREVANFTKDFIATGMDMWNNLVANKDNKPTDKPPADQPGFGGKRAKNMANEWNYSRRFSYWQEELERRGMTPDKAREQAKRNARQKRAIYL